MNMRRLIFISLILLALTSCKKDDIYDDPGYAIGIKNSPILQKLQEGN